MSLKKNTLPIGELLQNAGLISDKQLEIALGVQSQHPQMKLGEILSMQEVIDVRTVDFFADQWQKIKQDEQKFSLDYCLKKAFILNDKQIEYIVAEQQNSNLNFSDIAEKKGWIKQKTLDFFLKELARETPSLMSLIDLEEYNQQHLHLEKKYANYSLILSRVLAWTGGNPTLTKNICSAVADNDVNIPAGMEINAVDKLIESSLIRNWQTSQLGTYVRSIEEKLTNNSRCESILLLAEYQNILLSNEKKYEQLKEQQELLNLGIVVNDQNRLRVTNLIFQQIFNQNWLIKARKKVENRIQQEFSDANLNKTIKKQSPSIQLAFKINNDQIRKQKEPIKINSIKSINKTIDKVESTEFLTKFGSLFTLAGIVLLIPFALIINNYSSSRQVIIQEPNNISEANKLQEFCNEINLFDSSSTLENISQIEKSKKLILETFTNTLEDFPENCETVLNNLRVLAAPQLGKEGRVIEAIKNLCKIPSEDENINEAKIWIERWYQSPSWGRETKSYLNSIENCPADQLDS